MQGSLLKPYRSVGLFSEHYVEKRLPETDMFGRLKPPGEIRDEINRLYGEVKKTVNNKKESQLENDFIRPVLNVLGIQYIVEVTTPAGSPDYAFFPDVESKSQAEARGSKKYEGAVALADAKRWGRDFEGRGNALDENPNAVPTRQIANYITETGIEWGVLTDGRRWRLYNRNTHPVSQSYFEIDLIEALDDPELFHLFYAVFSGPAFEVGAQKFILDESKDYWAAIGDDLKDRAYEALAQLCNGFYRNDPGADIKDIYEASIILLYRLLFVLHAESRELLPVKNGSYASYSLNGILDEMAKKSSNEWSTKLRSFYSRLEQLFDLINEGDESIGVYQYNGGLFKDGGLPFLPASFFRDNAVPDRYLASALVLVAYAREKKGGEPRRVDYSELDVRHLGSIYEGLLEYHPRLEDGEIKLYTDKGERKATGSYYTPDYIVNYIVENTLGPLTEDIKDPDDVLTLKVLDPAMGSGHFLVGAIDFIGRRCLALAGGEAEVSEEEYRRIAVERCIYGVDLNPLAVELAKLSLWLHTITKDKPLSFLDHHLKLGNSLVGARVDDLAELPKKRKKKSEQQNIFVIRLKEKLPFVLGKVVQILTCDTTTIKDIEDKEAWLIATKKELEPFLAVADTWVSTYFGNDVSDDEYSEIVGLINMPAKLLERPAVQKAVATSHGDEHRTGREFFHWELEFPEVFFDEKGREKENPGFDAVIGNPPYVVVKDDGFYEKLTTYKAKDTYAYFLERGIGVLSHDGFIGMIVPLSLVCSRKKEPLRIFIEDKCSKVRVPTFAKRPSSIFPMVQQRTSIFFGEKDRKKFRIFTTKYNRWYSGDEKEMISSLDFIDSTLYRLPQGWPKVGDKIGLGVLDKIRTVEGTVGDYLSGEVEFYYHKLGMYWLNAYTFKPLFKDEHGQLRDSTNLGVLYTGNKRIRDFLVGLINSSLFYFYWIVYSDDFHLNKSEISEFPAFVDFKKFGKVYDQISRRVSALMRGFEEHSFLREARFGKDVKIWQELQPGKSKNIIDEIDTLLSMIYGLTDEETQFVIHFDERFRLGDKE